MHMAFVRDDDLIRPTRKSAERSPDLLCVNMPHEHSPILLPRDDLMADPGARDCTCTPCKERREASGKLAKSSQVSHRDARIGGAKSCEGRAFLQIESVQRRGSGVRTAESGRSEDEPRLILIDPTAARSQRPRYARVCGGAIGVEVRGHPAHAISYQLSFPPHLSNAPG